MRVEDRPRAGELGAYAPDCRFFSGYKPCRHKRLCDGCPRYEPRGTRILLVNLDAMGDVVRTTALLPALKRKYPVSHVTWVTLKNAEPILRYNPLVDEVLVYGPETVLELEPRTFDVVLNVDKSRRSGALTQRVGARERLGFGVDEHGAIVPLTPAAHYQYWTGLDDELKFFRNRKSEQEMLAETMGAEFRRDPYVLPLSEEEQAFVASRRRAWGLDGAEAVVGINTGCSELYPYKRLPAAFQAQLADALWERFPGVRVVLLGGPEDAARNPEIARLCRAPVLETPCTEGLRRGMQYIELADVVLTGDSLGMHLAIGRGKRVVAWFGLTCEQEIDFFDRGEAVLARVGCRPCWQRSCDRPVKCYESVDLEELLAAAARMIQGVREEKDRGSHRTG
ncbi:MAG: glycosyltransferase family 9 protein [Deltaproteobacteria bacterium]|nr:glycosyltransferase family 9 protein [Deltaproteobacteria bacterium]